jgi:hypothetical protein
MQDLMQRRLRAAASQLSCDLGGEAAILHVERGRYFTVNATGAIVWRHLRREPATVDALTGSVADHFGIPVAECARDVAAFLEQLEDAGLVVPC